MVHNGKPAKIIWLRHAAKIILGLLYNTNLKCISLPCPIVGCRSLPLTSKKAEPKNTHKNYLLTTFYWSNRIGTIVNHFQPLLPHIAAIQFHISQLFPLPEQRKTKHRQMSHLAEFIGLHLSPFPPADKPINGTFGASCS